MGLKIGILGSGGVAQTLAKGFAADGHAVQLGSRDAGKLAAVNLSGINTLRLVMNVITDNNEERFINGHALNYLAFVPAMLLESSATVDGTYSIETTASVEPGSRHITVPQNGPRFYRLRTVGTARPNITSFNLVGSNIELTYQ